MHGMCEHELAMTILCIKIQSEAINGWGFGGLSQSELYYTA